jgi:hypothetical protein
MDTEQRDRDALDIEVLPPLALTLPASPTTILDQLRRISDASLSAPADDTSRARRLNYPWNATQRAGQAGITYVLCAGPLEYLQCEITPEVADTGDTTVNCTCSYSTINNRWKGNYARGRAQQEAIVLRDEVLNLLTLELSAAFQSVTAALDDATPVGRRRSDRYDVRVPARLWLGRQAIRAEVLNVSGSGIAVFIKAELTDQQTTQLFHQDGKTAELEIVLQGEACLVPVVVRHAQSKHGGVYVGLHAFDADAIKPLLRRAFSQTVLNG